MGSQENWQKLAGGENSYQSIRVSSVGSLQSPVKRKVNFHIASSFPNPEFGLGVPICCQSFVHQDGDFLLVLTVLCAENLVQLSACVGHAGCLFLRVQAARLSGQGPDDMANRNVGCTPRAARALLSVASFQGNRVFLPAVFRRDSESGEDSIFCTLWGNNSFVHNFFSTVRNVYYQSWLKPDKILG